MTLYQARRTFEVGQRVRATFLYEHVAHLGVVSQDSRERTVSVQFEPCGCHYSCLLSDVSAYGDRNGWTDQEYRVARETTSTFEHAVVVENERRARYPDAPFSAYRGK